MAFKSFKDISKSALWGTENEAKQSTWASVQRGLLIRQTEALELMASNHQKLLDDIERYRRAYSDYKLKCESLQAEIQQLKSVSSRYRNQRDTLKAQLEEKQVAI